MQSLRLIQITSAFVMCAAALLTRAPQADARVVTSAEMTECPEIDDPGTCPDTWSDDNNTYYYCTACSYWCGDYYTGHEVTTGCFYVTEDDADEWGGVGNACDAIYPDSPYEYCASEITDPHGG